MDTEETAVSLPSAAAVLLGPNLTLQPPLSRRGHGPGLIIIVSEIPKPQTSEKPTDPPPLLKWAEEGYATVQIKVSGEGGWLNLSSDIQEAIEVLKKHPECDEKEKFGLIVYSTSHPSEVAKVVNETSNIVCVTAFGELPGDLPTPKLMHLASRGVIKSVECMTTIYRYPEVKSTSFVIPDHEDFISASAAVAHSRTLTFLKAHVGGPIFDIEAIWEEHTYFEFENRSVAQTMGTMVQEPYVNHITTMTGGIGRASLTNFYRYHFIWNNPEDTALELVSRTIGIDRIVDEFVFGFTHNKVIDWLIPGIPPTGKRLRIPMTSVVNVRGDRLYHEHIAWDQGTVLVQLGLMPEYLPYPYCLPDGQKPGDGKKFEYRVPVAGVETAEKLMDEGSVPSNEMFTFSVREVEK